MDWSQKEELSDKKECWNQAENHWRKSMLSLATSYVGVFAFSIHFCFTTLMQVKRGVPVSHANIRNTETKELSILEKKLQKKLVMIQKDNGMVYGF